MILKTKISILAAICALCAFGVSNAAGPSGEFTGQADGRNAPVKVSVKIDNGKIADVKIVEHQESPGISDPAIAIIPEQILSLYTYPRPPDQSGWGFAA